MPEMASGAVPSSRSYHQDSSTLTSSSYQYFQPSPAFPEYAADDGSTTSTMNDLCQYYSTASSISNYPPVTPTFSPLQYVQQRTPRYDTAQYSIQQSVDQFSLPAPTGGLVYAGDLVPSTPVYCPAPVRAYAVPSNYREAPISPPSTTSGYHAPPDSTPVVKTEARKVIITQLSSSTSVAELKEQLVKIISKSNPKARISSSASQSMIHELEIATHSDGKPKGHAFAVFETYELARHVITSLDGLRYRGRTLSARFAKEGAEPANRHSPQALSDSQTISPPSNRRQPVSSSYSSSSRHSGKTSRPSRDETHRDSRRLAPYENEDDQVGNEDVKVLIYFP